jgi:hypothetical protein
MVECVEKPSLIIAGLSLIVTILTLIVTILTLIVVRRNSKKEYKVKLSIHCNSCIPFDVLKILITNNGIRPLTLNKYSIGIGTSEDNQKEIIAEEYTRKINESEEFLLRIKRDDIQDCYRRLGLKQEYRRRLWVNLSFTAGNTVSRVIYIAPEIITDDFDLNAEQFIATDIFLGLPQMPPDNSNMLYVPVGFSTDQQCNMGR